MTSILHSQKVVGFQFVHLFSLRRVGVMTSVLLHTEAKTESPHLVALSVLFSDVITGAGGLGALRFSG